MFDHRAELLEVANRAQGDLQPVEMLEIATALYGLARVFDNKGILQIARQGMKPAKVFPFH